MTMEQAEAPCAFQSTLDGQPPDKQTRKTYTWRHAAKRTSFPSSSIRWRPLQTVGDSYPLADMETLDNTLDQVHSIFVRQTCRKQ